MKLDEVGFTSRRAGRCTAGSPGSNTGAPSRRSRRARLLRGVHAKPRGRGPDANAYRIPPQSQDMAVLHDASSLIQVARHNLDVGNDGIAVFEIAHVYRPSTDELPDGVHVAGLAQAPFARAKGAVEEILAASRATGVRAGEHPLLHPGQTATTTGGILGGLRPAVGGRLERVRARPRRARSRRGLDVRGRHHLSTAQAGPCLCRGEVSRRIWWKLHVRPCRSSGRWRPSTSTEASRSARGASRSRSAPSSVARADAHRRGGAGLREEDRRRARRALRRPSSLEEVVGGEPCGAGARTLSSICGECPSRVRKLRSVITSARIGVSAVTIAVAADPRGARSRRRNLRRRDD